jgi:chromosomal replication initiation ATPase DnaA
MSEFFQLNLFSNNLNEKINFEKIYSKEKYIITGSNFYQVSYISNIENWKTDKICMLHGPRFSGKTHLCYMTYQKNIESSFLINKLNMNLISDYETLNSKNLIILDDINLFNEEIIFHFFNYIRLYKKFLLISSETNFLENIKLQDLKSRIFSIPSFALNTIDENLLKGIIIKILSDDEIILSSNNLNYICLNLERSFSTIHNFTIQIKKFISENSKQINLKIIKKILSQI